MAEANPGAARECVLDYRPDRQASAKLAQVYNLLVPSTAAISPELNEVFYGYKQDSRDLRTSLLRPPKGAEHHCQPTECPAGVCPGSSVCGSAGMDFRR